MTEAKHTDRMIDNAPAHIFPDDLERMETCECTATVYSVSRGHPTRGETVPLFSADSHYALVEALGECISVMEKNIYPKPDAPEDHPYSVLERARAARKQAKGES